MRVRIAAAAIAAIGFLTAAPGFENADAGDDYPIPNRILKTPCTVDQYVAAARDVEPVYYERYMIDYNNRPHDIQQGAPRPHLLVLLAGLRGTAAVFGGHRYQRLLRANGNSLGQLGEAVLQQ